MTDGSAAYLFDLGSAGAARRSASSRPRWSSRARGSSVRWPRTTSSVQWVAAELPAGKTQGTLQYTNCWGMAKDGDNKVAAQSASSSSSPRRSSSSPSPRSSARCRGEVSADDYKTANPTMVPFINGAAYASNLPAMEGAADAIKELNTGIAQLKAKDPKAILDATCRRPTSKPSSRPESSADVRLMATISRTQRGSGIFARTAPGGLFVLPTILILGVFLFFPVVMAAWVSLSDWRGRGSPFGAGVDFVARELRRHPQRQGHRRA